jgi:hypothetical protein
MNQKKLPRGAGTRRVKASSASGEREMRNSPLMLLQKNLAEKNTDIIGLQASDLPAPFASL